MMTQAKPGDTVRVHYTGKMEDGEVFDSTAGRLPLEFTIGKGMVIAGFEKAINGMAPGETKTVTLAYHEAYGPHRKEMVMTIDRGKIPDDLEPKPGEQLQLRQSDGQTFSVLVREVTESSITLDTNHKLAGKDLTFELELVEIVEAS